RNIHVKTHFNITYSTRIATSNDPIAVGCKQRTTQRNERTSFLIYAAGQYFTTRPLIDAIIECLAPKPGETMIDPACGTGGFLIAMFLYIVENVREMTREQRDHLRYQALHGIDIVQSVVRLCAMNLLLHNVGPTPAQLDAKRRQLLEANMPLDQVDGLLDELLPVRADDALRQLGAERYDLVATNVPFGRKSSIKVIGEDGDVGGEAITYERDDFWATTSNKQLNLCSTSSRCSRSMAAPL
ncbi:MAG: class I SAM-dependent DNA methyltransferase, partial [Cyanobacteriota bacterium]